MVNYIEAIELEASRRPSSFRGAGLQAHAAIAVEHHGPSERQPEFGKLVLAPSAFLNAKTPPALIQAGSQIIAMPCRSPAQTAVVSLGHYPNRVM